MSFFLLLIGIRLVSEEKLVYTTRMAWHGKYRCICRTRIEVHNYLTDLRFSGIIISNKNRYRHVLDLTLDTIDIVLRHCLEELFLRDEVEDFVADIALYDDFVLILVIFRYTCPSCKFIGKFLGCSLETIAVSVATCLLSMIRKGVGLTLCQRLPGQRHR